MRKPFLTYIANLVVVLSLVQAGLFPVLPGEPVFPFSGQNAITPDYPPFDQPGIVDLAGFSHQFIGFHNWLTGGPVQGAFSDWISQEDFLPRIQLHEISISLYQWESISMESGLASVQIIFPFHEFW